MFCEEQEWNTSQVHMVSLVTRKYGIEVDMALAEKKEENQKRDSLFRYRDSPEEIQGEC